MDKDPLTTTYDTFKEILKSLHDWLRQKKHDGCCDKLLTEFLTAVSLLSIASAFCGFSFFLFLFCPAILVLSVFYFQKNGK